MTYGGFWVRLMAHNIDLIVLLPIYYLIGFLMTSDTLVLLSCLSFTWLYEVGFSVSEWQGTPGKRFMHLKVTGPSYQRMTLIRSAFRTLVKTLSLMTFFVGYAMIAFHPSRKALHDQLTGTTVISTKGF